MNSPTSKPRPTEPRAMKLCTACNARMPADAKQHCPSPACPWWKCEKCGASNDSTGANDQTYRNGVSRSKH